MNSLIEIEQKYWANNFTKEDFEARIRNHHNPMVIKSHYVVSCDDYYIRRGSHVEDFIRFRKGGDKFELTLKRKEVSNLIRKEINLDVSQNDDLTVSSFLSFLGYEKSFQVYKEAWIWRLKNCEASYYTLSDGRSIIELEAHGEFVDRKSAISAITEWENYLSIKDLVKESRSLYEIYIEENALKNISKD